MIRTAGALRELARDHSHIDFRPIRIALSGLVGLSLPKENQMRWLLIMLLLFACGFPGHAGILYNNIDPIQSPGSDFINNTGRAMVSMAHSAFTPTSSGQLGTILAALDYNSFGTPDAVTLQMNLHRDCGPAPGTFDCALLESLSIPSQFLPYQIVEFTSTTHSTLIAGDTYWLSIAPMNSQGEALDDAFTGMWSFNKLGIRGLTWTPLMGTFESDQVALTVYAASSGDVPEPTSVLLLAGGMLALAAFRRRSLHRH